MFGRALGNTGLECLQPMLRFACLQGEAGDQFYVVKEGEAVVYQSTPQGVKTVNRLFKADYFGERALLTQEPRCLPLRCFHSPIIVALSWHVIESPLTMPVS